MRPTSLAVACLPLIACAAPPPPEVPAPSASAPTVVSAPASAASSGADDAQPPVHRRPLELTNGCPHDVHLYYGEQPGDGKGQSTTVATGASVPVPRGPDGAVVVWVVDDKGLGLANVHVTKFMRHVRFDASCSRLEADTTR
ncbi:MAG TPA: hypothetical protein VIF15_03180 [Polyangiaceae bacterium]